MNVSTRLQTHKYLAFAAHRGVQYGREFRMCFHLEAHRPATGRIIFRTKTLLYVLIGLAQVFTHSPQPRAQHLSTPLPAGIVNKYDVPRDCSHHVNAADALWRCRETNEDKAKTRMTPWWAGKAPLCLDRRDQLC